MLIPFFTSADMPNAFHANQMASGAVAAGMDGCQQGMRKRNPTISTSFSLYYCSCSLDWLRDNLGKEPIDKLPVAKCMDWAKRNSK